MNGRLEGNPASAGTDATYFVDNASDVLIDAGGVDTVVTSVSWTLGADFENLTMSGSAALSMQGNNLDNYVVGNSGENKTHFVTRTGFGVLRPVREKAPVRDRPI